MSDAAATRYSLGAAHATKSTEAKGLPLSRSSPILFVSLSSKLQARGQRQETGVSATSRKKKTEIEKKMRKTDIAGNKQN